MQAIGAKVSKRLDHLRTIEKNLQQEWKAKKLFEAKHLKDWEQKLSFEDKNKEKYMVTFPYPYMNGRLHLGHAFSMTKCEFQSRYQRLLGKNVLFPFSFHCTGMPIAAAANKIKYELQEGIYDRFLTFQPPELAPKNADVNKENAPDKKVEAKGTENKKDAKKDAKKDDKKKQVTQTEILSQVGVDKQEIPKFADPTYWLEYFPPIGQRDLENFGVGVDFSRSFITTPRQKFYDKFIEWHFNKLQKAGQIKFGKRHTIFSRSDDQPCADHDRSEGEGVGTQEYTLIKLKIVDNMPEKLKKYNQNIFLVAATLRPETMYGQTNCFVLPNGEYGLYEMKDGDLYISSNHGAINMAYQELTKDEKVANSIEKIMGRELIGVCVEAPLSYYNRIYAIPMETISMTKGTGIVTSVPSDAPDDWINLSEFQKDEKLREKHGIKPEMVDFKPVHIIKIPGYGEFPAVDACQTFEVNSSKDKEKLAKAKDDVYSKGFYSGVMTVGEFTGLKVQEAKVKVKQHLINQNLAVSYYEPESTVKNRMGEECIVALVDQWFITYGQEDWRAALQEHIHSEHFMTYNHPTLRGFEEIINWLKDWGCSRTFGLGSRIPWDQSYLIESLSDSTIYMSYYTIANFLHEDMYGDNPKNGLSAEQFTEEVFDFIFLGHPIENARSTGISDELLKEMRDSFTYWYPMDLRCSGKDLIGNHLTMALYNHAFVWQDKKWFPRGYFCNGYILVNGEKMSKQKGNFFTLSDIIDKYGCDASRIALADCGDGLDDANFLPDIADSSVNRLYSFENFIKILINEFWITKKITHKDAVFNDPDSDQRSDTTYFDKIFENNIHYLIDKTKHAYDQMKYKDVVKYGLYEMIVKFFYLTTLEYQR